MDSNPNISPVNPLPPVVVALALAFFLIEAGFNLGARGLIGGPQAIGWRELAIGDYAPSGFLFDRMVEAGRYPADFLLRFVAYPFLHVTFTHMLFSAVIVLAIGKFVGEVFGGVALIAVFFLASIGGALVYCLIVDDRLALVGAMPGNYGLIGAFTFILWVNLGAHNENRMRAFSLIGLLLLIQLVFGLLFGGSSDWIAKFSGFVIGFLFSFVVSPGGWNRLLARMRQR
jgi:membrane associated rhomboid family serine protease